MNIGNSPPLEVRDDRFVRHELKSDGHRASGADLMIGAGLAVATLAICLYFAPRGYQAGFVDMGHDGYQLRQVLDLSEGGVIFRDTFDQYGAFNGYLNTVGFVLLGHRLLAMKYFICGWYSLIAVALFVVARHWLNPVLAAFSVMVWLGLAPFYQHGIMISPHVYVLFFQTLATIVAVRARSLEPRRFALVGVLTGLSWSMKQSMGVLFLVSILVYLACQLFVRRRAGSRGVLTAAMALALGFLSVIGVVLAFLWVRGAFGDWYLQTVVFPREFYLVEYGRRSPPASGLRMLSNGIFVLTSFITMQTAQSLYWLVIRVVVLIAALARLLRQRPDDDLVLMASITAFLWLGAFPSANFMHQWWTASLAIPPFVYCAQKLLTRVTRHDAVLSVVTMVLVLTIVGGGLVDRKNATTFRAGSLSETIAEPPVFRGIRTDPPTKRAFETMYGVMSRYQAHHPGTKIVSIDAADAYWSGINESLPFLSALDGNTHPQPVYWNLPVLTTNTYPSYNETLWRDIGAQHPLLIEHREGVYKPLNVSSYVLLAAVQSDSGYWYLYGADQTDRAQHGEVSTYLARDGKTESGFAEHGAVPQLAERLSSNVEAAWRGRVAPQSQSGEPVELPGAFPFVLHDQALANARGPIDVYTWPPDLRTARLEGAIEPLSADPIVRADIVREFGAGAWTIDGQAQRQYSYLLEFREAPIARGAYFVVRGELEEGGFTVGFLDHGQWSNYVNVTQQGLFEIVLQFQQSGRYGLIVANCLETGWGQTGWRYRIRDRLGLAKTAGANRFRVTEAGWIPLK